MSGVYFFLFGAFGALGPFLSLYYRSAGLSGTEISILVSIPPLLLFVSQPIFGPLTDRSGHRGRMLAGLLLAASVAALLMPLGSSFVTLLPLILLWAFFAGPLVSTADSIALGEVQRTGVAYPQLRLWGSVGFVLTSTILGRLYNLLDLRWAFAFYAGMNLAAIWLSRRLPGDGISPRRAIWPVLRQLLRNPLLVGFLFLSALMQTTQGAHQAFFSIHLEHLGGTRGMVGLAWGIAALVEVPVWMVLDRVARRTGPLPLLALSGFVYSLRWYLFSVVTSPEAVLWLMLLQAFSYAIFLPTAVMLIGQLIPDDLRTSGQALLVMVNSGIAMVLGNLTAGYIVDQSGTATLYQVASYVALASGLGFLLLFRRTRQVRAGA
ncbi:MAG: MFS transporter [Bacillota bacterium]